MPEKKALTAVCACVRFQLQHHPKKDLILTSFFFKKNKVSGKCIWESLFQFCFGEQEFVDASLV